ncbi:MAG: hypothetical protein IJ410_03550 [Oscillospiraceae bacterium]|nr:hypothetical protein [Oscillospiraceae bacterium]
MAYKLIDKEYSHTQGGYVQDYICDTNADVASLPVCRCGSSALVIDTGDVYVVNTTGEWAKVGG